MARKGFSSITDQVTETLRQGMMNGKWRGTLPGRDQLAERLGCSHPTVEEAMRRLSKEGLLVSQGPGRRRRIVLPAEGIQPSVLRIKVLHYEASDRQVDYFLEMIHRLQDSGHEASFADESLRELNMDIKRVVRLVEKTPADAWIVIAAPEEVLEWFARRATPAFALFGRFRNLPIAGTAPQKLDAIVDLVDRLVALGHRRIVNLVGEERRKPTIGLPEQVYLEQLAKHGIKTSEYNLPDWEDSPEGLQVLLDSLFKYTPPTALLADQASHFFAARDHLAHKGVLTPEHISMACFEPSPLFDWFRPAITHIEWNPHPVIGRVVKWVNNISRGKEDRRQKLFKANLELGGTIGPASGQ